MVFWHTDLVHAVEAQHRGAGDSSVMYIPAIPLTNSNWEYVRQQREDFVAGFPPSDFPGGQGERTFEGRAEEGDIVGETARSAMGFSRFPEDPTMTPLELALVREANASM